LKQAIIFGVSGQDGTYLARSLLKDGYRVHGTSRGLQGRLANSNVASEVVTSILRPTCRAEVAAVLDYVQPDEIYNLSGQSSVGLSFEHPADTFESNTLATLNILEEVRLNHPLARYFNACSSEMFGNVECGAATERTRFSPLSPYGVAKSASYQLVKSYRQSYGLFAVSGILFNHESPLRPENFITRKVVRSAVDIYESKRRNLVLGNLSIVRDWGWAPEYVEAIRRMLEVAEPEDFVIATGRSISLENFVDRVFSLLNLDWRQFVEQDPTLFRLMDIRRSLGDASNAEIALGWRASTDGFGVAEKLLEAEFIRRRRQVDSANDALVALDSVF